jgi:hypothetical protein
VCDKRSPSVGTEVAGEARVTFSTTDWGLSHVTWFSAETQFHLDDYTNKIMSDLRPSENPRLTVANALHSESVTVGYALPSVRVFGPVFITSYVYLGLLGVEFSMYLWYMAFQLIQHRFDKMVPNL